MPDIARLRVEIDEVTPAVIRRVDVPVAIDLRGALLVGLFDSFGKLLHGASMQPPGSIV